MATGEDLSLLCIATNYTQIIEQVLSANSPGIVLDSRKQASTLGSVGGKEEKLTWLPSRMFPEVWRRATEKTFAWHLDSSWGKSRTSHLTAARQEWSSQTWVLLTLLYVFTLLYMCPAGLLKLLFCASAANLGESNTLNGIKKLSKLFILIVPLFFWLVCLACVSQLRAA